MANLDLKIESFERTGPRRRIKWTLESDLNGEVTLEQLTNFLNEGLVRITNTVLEQEQRKGFPKSFNEITDGVINKPYEEVDVRKKGEIIISTARSVREIVTFVYDVLIKNSPIDTGRYLLSHALFYNLQLVARTPDEAERWVQTAQVKPGDIIQFINYQPYARKLEREGRTRNRQNPRVGKTRSGPYKKQNFGLKPNGTYFLAANAARRKFNKGFGLIKFEFITGEPGFTNLSNIPRKTFKGNNRPYLYPSIIFVIGQNVS